MNTDIKGCTSTTEAGSEQYENFRTKVNGRYQNFVQYDYRHTNGALFSCVKPTLTQCREARDKAIKAGTL